MGVTGVRDVREIEERRKEREEKEKSKKIKEAPKRKSIEGVRGIIRVAEADLDGTKKVKNAILKIKGIGKSLHMAIPKASGIDSEALLGSLTEEQIKHLEEVMKNPTKFGIPENMINRQRDYFTGESKHLVASGLSFAVKSDIDFMKKIRCYKGKRHELGLPVRGQRTRSSFRTGMIVGVARKAAKMAAKAEAPKEGKKAVAAPEIKEAPVPAKAEAKKEEKK